MQAPRERLSTRLGFLLLSAGCAIGLGNVWRFPYIAGQYGGAVFVMTYLLCLFGMGLPILVMEFAIGRASRRNMGAALAALEPRGTSWHSLGWFSLVGSYLLMMFYMPVTGWMMSYCWHMGNGNLSLPPEQVTAFFGNMLQDPATMLGWTLLASACGFGVCALGVQKGLERVSKILMLGLLIIMLGLALRAVTLPGASEGIAFYLAPDWGRAVDAGLWKMLNAAMGQAFFTLSVGMGSMLIFGSYLDNRRTLTGESMYILCLDTFVAMTAGLIIFPACFAFGVHPDQGPSLVFITLPNVFHAMGNGRLWGSFFFIFMSFAALTTVIAVVENILSYSMDVWGWTRRKAVLFHGILLSLLTLPCILGFNVWSNIQPLGAGSTILDLEDFLISSNLLPIGSFLFVLFCTSRRGWGWDKFVTEADKGEGPRFPRYLRIYLTFVVPVLMLIIFIQGYIQKFL